MTDYPMEIADEEPIIRVLKSPQYVNKNNQLKRATFRPASGKALSSVFRWVYRIEDLDALKSELIRIGTSGNNLYWGVAIISAVNCRKAGLDLEDARDEYQGHAHIVFPYAAITEPFEPLMGEAFVRQNEVLDSLISDSKPIKDIQPDKIIWVMDLEEFVAP